MEEKIELLGRNESGILINEKIKINGKMYYEIIVDQFSIYKTYQDLKKIYPGVKDTLDDVKKLENLNLLQK